MLGQVGSDDDGKDYIQFLQAEGINTEGIRRVENVPTGMAFIISQQDGENAIIINGGANMEYHNSAENHLEQSWMRII